ncbi:ATP-binding protein [Novosphingopyxis iocasae]|uniref:ATP-binding protein n=1 Tax=Novosphingopyxis iocasae TaxID=2762729 RepID=UPI0016512600|nr:ATP-binding protein [Novosphingopyxis iocasae]
MSHDIVIGHEASGAAVPIDIEELLASRLLVQGNSGSGKSHLLRRLLEESAKLVQQVVIDPEGDFVSLADHFGHVLIDGASYAPAEIEALGARIRAHRASVVLALEGLEVEQQIRCAAQFLNALFDAPREHWFPALVVVDEAQLFAPAVAGEISEDTRRLTLSAMTNLMCRGRKRGLAGIVATQRLAKLAKNVAAEASNFLMGRTFLDIDMARAADLLGMERRQAERIRDLERGHFLGLGPAISRRPVAVKIGPVQSGPRTAASGLLPLPEVKAEDMEALLHEELAAATPPPPPPPPPRPAEELVSDIAEFARAPDPPQTLESSADARDAMDAVLTAMAREANATFRSPSRLYQDFATRVRQQKIGLVPPDLNEFRRRFSIASADLDRLDAATRATILQLAGDLSDDVLAPFLVIARAAAEGLDSPDEDELARVYGSSSPGRIRRLLEHFEKTGHIVVRTEFGGGRRIFVPGLADILA